LSSTTEHHTQITAEELAHTFEEVAPEADLGGYALEDWLSFAIFWVMTLCVFLQFFTRYVLNDSFAWTEEIATYCLVVNRVCRLGDVRAAQPPHPGRLPLPLPAGRACARALDRHRPHPHRFLLYGAILIWRYIGIISGEEMTTIRVPKNLFYGFVFLGFLLMFLRSVQVLGRQLAPGFSVLERPEAYDAPVVKEA
jgi:TRAP-type C4-dicarboxylate transport system permease small subunit